MERVFRFVQRALGRACVGLGVAAVVVGCHSAARKAGGDCPPPGHKGGLHGGFLARLQNCGLNIDNCSDIPQGSIPQPIGTFTNRYLNLQAAKGERDDFVLYYSDWMYEKAVLGPFGSERLGRIAARLPYTPFTVIVQPEPDQPADLTNQRYQAVVAALTAAGIENAAQRVVIGPSPAEGLYGEEAPRIFQSLLQGGGGFGGGGLGFSGVGFGGGFGGGGFGFR
jgi:hypothetical protein